MGLILNIGVIYRAEPVKNVIVHAQNVQDLDQINVQNVSQVKIK